MRPAERVRRLLRPRARPLSRRASRLLWTAAAGASLLAARRLRERLPSTPEGGGAGWWDLVKKAAARAGADQVSRLGAALAFYTLLSMAPLLLIAVAVVGLVFGRQAAAGAVVGQLRAALGPGNARVIQNVLLGAQRSSAEGGAFGFLFLLIGASYVVSELQSSLNFIFGLPASKIGWGGTVRGYVASLAFVLLSGLLLLASLGITAGITAAGGLFGASAWAPAALHAASIAVSFCFIAFVFGLIYRVLPQAVMRWRDAFLGGAVTAALLEVGNVLLGLYLGKSGASSAYGAAGGLVALLLWSYYCAQIVYVGAEFTNVYAKERGEGIAAKG